MQLLNTIEISPYDFSDKEYDSPNVSKLEFSDEWYKYWKKCISDKNLGRLEPIEKGSYLVDIKTINDEELEEIVNKELEEVELSEFEDQVGEIYGGIVLCENNKICIEPSCCGDIGNIAEWEDIFTKELNEWNQLWIGHPWIFYRRVNGNIEFSEYSDSNLEDLKDIKILITISESDLQAKLNEIRKEQNEFEFRIRNILEKMGIANAERISKLLTGNG